MSLPRGTIAGRPTLTIIDLLEKHKGTGAFQFKSLADAIRYISRTFGENELSASDLQALAHYMARDGAAWVRGINFHSKKLSAMIKEMELTARPLPGNRGVPFGVIVISTSKSGLSRTKQMRKLKVAGLRTLRYLNVDRNRAFLAIHDDTDHLHLHIVYNRYDSLGRLTEREPGKFRRYLMEDICARVAFDIGYNLEPGARTVPLQTGELIDLTSGQVIRTLDFEPLMTGCKARNSERRRARTGHELEGIALKAYRGSNDLAFFRARLALSGIRYVRKGSGAVFIDADGKSHKASKVNYCLGRGRIFDGAFKDNLPDDSDVILKAAERSRSLRGVVTPATGNDAPAYTDANGLAAEQVAEANRRLLRGYSDFRCGRPRKIDMGEGWPKCFPWGGLKFPKEYLDDFRSFGIEIRDRGYHAELWREQRLLAVHCQDQIVVYTRDKEDLRILLLAAHQKWGRVKLTGSTAFKNQMVDLAAELNVPITNPELQRRMKAQQEKLSARRINEGRTPIAQQAGASGRNASDTAREQSRLDVPGPNEEQSSGAKTASALGTGAGNKPDELGEQSKLDVESGLPSPPIIARAPDVAMNPPQKASGGAAADCIPPASTAAKAGASAGSSRIEPPAPVPLPAAPSIDRIPAVLRELRANNQFVVRVSPDRHQLVHTANYRRMMEPLLDDPRVQTGLADLYRFQHAELDRLEGMFRDKGVSIRLILDVSARQEHTHQPAGLQGDAAELYRRYQYHPRCKEMLRTEHERREAIRQAQEDRRRRSEASTKVLSPPTGASAAKPTERKTHDVIATNAVGTRSPSVVRGQSEPHEDEASDGSINALAERPDQQSQSGSEEKARLDRNNRHPDQAKPDLERQLSVDGSTEARSVTGTATDDRGITADLPNASGDDRRTGRPASPPPKESPAVSELSAGDTAASPSPSLVPQKEAARSQPEEAVSRLAKQLQSDWDPRDNPQYTDLLSGLQAKLGGEWPPFQENWKRHAAAPDGQEKDRLAFVINKDLQISVADRVKYPQLRALFAASDRNLQDLQRQQQQAAMRRLQGGW